MHICDNNTSTTHLTQLLEEPQNSRYIQLTAKLNVFAMRTRLDLNLASSILSYKVTKPNVDDSNKLEHVIGYLLGTKDKSITIVKGDNQLRVWVDAAHMVNSDLKGQTDSLCNNSR